MRTYQTLKELEENSQELPEGIANHPMLTPMSKLVKESPVSDKKVHDSGHRDEKLLKKHDDEGGKSSVEKDAYPEDSSVPPEAKKLKKMQDVIKDKSVRDKMSSSMDTKEAQIKQTVNYEEVELDEATANELKKYMQSKWKTVVKASKVGTGKSMVVKGKIPNDFRAHAVKQFYPDAKILDKKNIDYGNIRPNYVSLRVGMWDELLKEQVEPELVEAKETGGVYVKYAATKKGPISQVYFSTRDQAEGFLQRINKMGAKGIITDKETKGAIPMGHSQVRRQQEVEISEEDVEEGAWDSIDWSAIADLAKSNPKKFKKKSDWIDWLNTNVAKDNPAAAKKAQRAWESMDVDEILDFIEEQCKCSELSVSVDGRTKQFKETRKRIESRLAKLKEKLRQATKESFKK